MQAWQWQRNPQPPRPQALVAFGSGARRLHARLLALSAAQQAALYATAGPEHLVVIGAAAGLPWVEGGQYASPSAEIPNLWFPTLWQPMVAAELLAAAVQVNAPSAVWLLCKDPAVLIPLESQLPVNPVILERMAEQWQRLNV